MLQDDISNSVKALCPGASACRGCKLCSTALTVQPTTSRPMSSLSLVPKSSLCLSNPTAQTSIAVVAQPSQTRCRNAWLKLGQTLELLLMAMAIVLSLWTIRVSWLMEMNCSTSLPLISINTAAGATGSLEP